MTRLLLLVAVAACARAIPDQPAAARGDIALPSAPHERVTTGLEEFLAAPPPIVIGKRIGLITNHTGADPSGTSAVDRLVTVQGVRLVALFGPEHGIRGTAAAGEKIESSVDQKTGIPVHSLYGTTQKPTPEMLRDVDVLLYDIQDVGARPYTYIYTLALAMQAAKEKGIPFVVLDRPNPVTGAIVEGGVLDTTQVRTFVGMYPLPARHGLTVGELARMYNRAFGIGVDLTVVPMRGWRRAMWLDQTGLPWVNPSPNIRSLTAATHYSGTVFVEATNLSEGRGSDAPFEQVGAPWLKADEVVRAMNGLALPGVRYETTTFTPTTSKHAGVPLRAVRLVITDRERYRPVRAAILLIDTIRRLHPNDFAFQQGRGLERLAGGGELRAAFEQGRVPALLDEWDRQAARFAEWRKEFLLY